jgi:hypothetical protein
MTRGQRLTAVVFSATLAVLLLAAGALTLDWKRTSGLFPWIVLIVLIPLVLWQLGVDVRRLRKSPEGDPDIEAPQRSMEASAEPEVTGSVSRQLAAAGCILVSFGVLWLLGVVIGSAVVTAAIVVLWFRERWWIGVICGGGTYLFLYVVFERLFSTPFPPGVLFGSLGG